MASLVPHARIRHSLCPLLHWGAAHTHVALIHVPTRANACVCNTGAGQLANLLAHNTTVHALDLRETILGREGAQHIARMLMRNTRLVTLDLASNAIEDVGGDLVKNDELRNKARYAGKGRMKRTLRFLV